jgi:hypothetical protein
VKEDLKKEFIKEVTAAAGQRLASSVFADMVRAWALAFESPLTLGERRKAIEAEYAQIKANYTEEEFVHFPIALAMVQMALERHREDFLGHALEELGADVHNGFTSEFFVHVQQAAQTLGIHDLRSGHKEIVEFLIAGFNGIPVDGVALTFDGGTLIELHDGHVVLLL